jgi:hypothetical protein
VHQADWYFYHDALSLMTARESIAWMKEQGYHDRWLLPLCDANEGTTFAGRPIGNSPEMMPLDSSLNKDVDDGVHRHISFTNHLDEDDPRKFSMATPKKGRHAYLRVWNSPPVPSAVTGIIREGGDPSSRRIVQDTNKFLVAIKVIREHKGVVVPGLGERKGHRGDEARENAKKGGIRIKETREVMDRRRAERWIHPDAEEARGEALSNMIDRYNGRFTAAAADDSEQEN